MTPKQTRRQFLQAMAALGGAAKWVPALSFLGASCTPKAQSAAKVVVLGGGFAGATFAKYLKQFDSSLQVTLVEPKRQYTTCPGSNWFLAGLISKGQLTHSYTALEKQGIRQVHQKAKRIDPKLKQVTLFDGSVIDYDRLVVAPGISFKNQIRNHDVNDVRMPHAYLGSQQIEQLKHQLYAMHNGGTVIIAAPPPPYRCPPGPAERVSMVAAYLKKHKPKSKILFLNPSERFAKQSLFLPLWQEHYGLGEGKMIEWINGRDEAQVMEADAAKRTILVGELEDALTADVVNLIPAQQAGQLAIQNHLVNEELWCPVNPMTNESTLHSNIYVIGDAALQSPLPKSAYIANNQAKICALNVLASLRQVEPVSPELINTCYSLVTENHGISITMRYHLDQGQIQSLKTRNKSLSNLENMSDVSKEAAYARAWYKNICYDSFA